MSADPATDRLDAMLTRLKLGVIRDSVDALLDEAARGDLSMRETLTMLCERELARRDHRRIEMAIGLARFPFVRDLASFDFSAQPSLDPKQLRDLAACRWVANGENLLLLGPPGVGKTHLAVALGRGAILAGYGALFISAAALVAQLSKAHQQGGLDDKLATLAKPKLLIIDELGYLPFDPNAAHLFFQLVSRRYERGAILITSNRTIGEQLYPVWKEKPDRDRPDAEMSQWLHALSDFVVRLVPFIAAQSALTGFIQPLGDRLDEDGLRYVAGVASSVVCRYVYDAEAISTDALAVVEYCTKRMLREHVFVRTSYSAGEIRGWDLGPMIQSLLFVSVTGAHGAARFANGEWRDVGQVLPLVDELMSAAGWVTYVRETYLTLAERAGGALPVDAFVRHVMRNIEAQNDHPQEWREGAILARIAGVVQGLAEANYPLRQDQAHDLLTVLDRLVDLGDRRAAALQQSEYFRGVQLQKRAA